MTDAIDQVSKQGETIERVLFNPNNGKLAVGIRLRFMDKYHSKELANLDGYKRFCEPQDCDGWAIDNEQGIFILVAKEFMEHVEDWGPL